jgi:hypothetical protein
MADKTIAQLEAELKVAQDTLEITKQNLELQNKTYEERIKLKAKEEELELKLLNIQLQKNEIEQKQLALNIQQIEKSGQFAINEKIQLEQLAKYNEEIRKNIEETASAHKKVNDELQKQQAVAKRLAKLLGIDKDEQDSLLYQLFKNPDKILGGVKKELDLVGGAASAFGSVAMKAASALVQNSIQQSLLADKTNAAFFAATAASQEYASSIYSVGRGYTALGIGFAEAGKALTDVYENLNTFTNLNQAARDSLVLTTAGLEKLGVSGTQTAQTIQSLSFLMGTSEEQAADTAETLAAMGPAMGMSAKRMISDFMQVKDQLSVFGDSMDDVFIKLQAQAKATGVSVNDLLNITNKFDTFEGAATQVAKLNAILGGPFLSSMAMIENTDPAERIDMLRQAVNQANVSFENMSYYEKKAIMDAGGFKSVEEMQRVLSMSAGAYAEELEIQAEKMKIQEERQKVLNEAMQRAQPIMDKLSMLAANFAIVLGPAITAISDFVSVIVGFMDNEYFATFIKGLTLALGALALFGTGPISLAIAAIIGIVAALVDLHDILFVPKSPILFDSLVSLPIIFEKIGNAAAGIANAIKTTADSFLKLHDSVVQNPAAFLTLADSMTALTAAMTIGVAGGFANSILSFFNADLASQIEDMAIAISKFDETKLFNFKVIMEKVVEISNPEVIDNFEKFTQKFDLVAKATNEVNVDNSQALTQMLTATQNIPQNLKLNQNQTIFVKIGDKQIKGIVEKVVDNSFADTNVYGAG